jgi:hypothetical protein
MNEKDGLGGVLIPAKFEGVLRGFRKFTARSWKFLSSFPATQFKARAQWFESPFPTSPLEGSCPGRCQERDQPGETSAVHAIEMPAADVY